MIEIPEVPGEFTIPPFDELTMLFFGIPGSGKTRFCAGAPNAIFFGTEPGQEFVKGRSFRVRDWAYFRELVETVETCIRAGRRDIGTVVVDIVDNLYLYCRDYICKQKKVDYPSSKDFGKTWAEINAEWSKYLRRLIDVVNVQFISHTTTRATEVLNDSGITEEIDLVLPSFVNNKASQYLDGVINAMGFLGKDKKGQFTISFKQTRTLGAKDRTDLLSKFGTINLPPNPDEGWAYIAKCYAYAAEQDGKVIKPRRS